MRKNSRKLKSLVLLAAATTGVVGLGGTTHAANTPTLFSTSTPDMSVGTNYTPNITPTLAGLFDVELSGAYTTTTLNINAAALNFGTLNDLDATQSLVIGGTGTAPI